jgi:acyl carrier protein
MDDIEKQVRDFIVDNYLFGNEEEAPDPEASFLELQLMDSTGVLELVLFLETTFGFSVADEELTPDNLDSIRKIGKFVSRKTGGA